MLNSLSAMEYLSMLSVCNVWQSHLVFKKNKIVVYWRKTAGEKEKAKKERKREIQLKSTCCECIIMCASPFATWKSDY